MLDAVHVLHPTDVHVAAFHSTWPVEAAEKEMTKPELELYEWFVDGGIDRDAVLDLIATQRSIDHMAIRTKHLELFVVTVLAICVLVLWVVTP